MPVSIVINISSGIICDAMLYDDFGDKIAEIRERLYGIS